MPKGFIRRSPYGEGGWFVPEGREGLIRNEEILSTLIEVVDSWTFKIRSSVLPYTEGVSRFPKWMQKARFYQGGCLDLAIVGHLCSYTLDLPPLYRSLDYLRGTGFHRDSQTTAPRSQ